MCIIYRFNNDSLIILNGKKYIFFLLGFAADYKRYTSFDQFDSDEPNESNNFNLHEATKALL